MGLLSFLPAPPAPVQRAVDYATDPIVMMVIFIALKFLHRVFFELQVTACRVDNAVHGNKAALLRHTRCDAIFSQRGGNETEIAKLEKEAAALKAHATSLATPSTFAKAAKMERQAIVLEKEAERLRAEDRVVSAPVRAAQVWAPRCRAKRQ